LKPSRLATAATMRRMMIHLIMSDSGNAMAAQRRRTGAGSTRRRAVRVAPGGGVLSGKPGGHVPHFARKHGTEALARNASRVQRREQAFARLLDRLIGEVERAPVATGGEGRVAEPHALDCLVGILVV